MVRRAGAQAVITPIGRNSDRDPRKTFGGDNFWENDLSISEATTDEGRLHNVLAFERKSMIDTINTVQ